MATLTEAEFAVVLGDSARPLMTLAEVDDAMRRLMDAGLASLPLPGSGKTRDRWRALATVGALDLSLAKIYEGHTDALAILSELGGQTHEGLWAVWAAEPPHARVEFHAAHGGGVLTGRKQWCSGAAVADHAVVSAWNEQGEAVLVQVNLRGSGVSVAAEGWNAVGMSACQSVAVQFTSARAEQLGEAGAYVSRPGFWQGGAGIAAVWFGAAAAVARMLVTSPRIETDSHAAAHLGAIDAALSAAKALLTETADWIDAHPFADASLPALRLRAVVEAAAHDALSRTGRALGPGPLCSDAIHAQRCADLPVFLRQSHAEQDLAALGRLVVKATNPWLW